MRSFQEHFHRGGSSRLDELLFKIMIKIDALETFLHVLAKFQHLEDHFPRETGIKINNLIHGVFETNEIKDKTHGNACSLDNRHSTQDIRIRFNNRNHEAFTLSIHVVNNNLP